MIDPITGVLRQARCGMPPPRAEVIDAVHSLTGTETRRLLLSLARGKALSIRARAGRAKWVAAGDLSLYGAMVLACLGDSEDIARDIALLTDLLDLRPALFTALRGEGVVT